MFTTLYLIRHGQSQGNIRYTQGFGLEAGKLGTPLSDEGIKQAQQLANNLKYISVGAIYSSPLLRAKQTAEILAKDKNIEIIYNNNLRERDRGNLNGNSESEVRQTYKALYGDPNVLSISEMWNYQLYSDMETALTAVERFINVLIEIVINNEGKTVLVISHGNVIRSFLVKIGYAAFKQIPQDSLENTGYVKIETDGISFNVLETQGLVKRT